MEDNYTTVVFRNKDVPSKVENEEQTLYSEVKIAPVEKEEETYATVNKTCSPAPLEKEEQIFSEVQIKSPGEEESNPAPDDKEEQTLDSQTARPSDEERTPKPRFESAANFHHFQPFTALTACVVTFSLILLVIIAVLIYFIVMMKNENNESTMKLNSIWVENQRLITEKRIQEIQTEEAVRQTDSLNWTLGVITKFRTFPVDRFCPQKKCQPCQTGWIHFQEKCYYFHSGYPWKTWHDSREYCKGETSDLVVTETVQEQEFISTNIQRYQSDYHGFWIGLRRNSDQNWQWVDGRNDTLGHWIQEPFGPVGSYALLIPGRPINASWDKAENQMRNKFICEQDILLKSV